MEKAERDMKMTVEKLRRRVIRKLGYRVTKYETLNYHSRQIFIYEYLKDLFNLASGVRGCVVECGYGYGMSFLALSKLAESEDIEIVGYDSFAGFPEPSKEDLSERQPKKGEWSHRTRNEAYRQICDFGLREEWTNTKVKLVEGFVELTLSKNPPAQPIRLLHIDLDLYSAYQVALNELWPLVATGGVVVFDEYNEVKWPGATSAIDEFFTNRSFVIEKHWSGKYFVKKIPAK